MGLATLARSLASPVFSRTVLVEKELLVEGGGGGVDLGQLRLEGDGGRRGDGGEGGAGGGALVGGGVRGGRRPGRLRRRLQHLPRGLLRQRPLRGDQLQARVPPPVHP